MSASDLELNVLGNLYFSPGWLELIDLRDADFSPGYGRATFTFITRHRADSPGEKLDPIILQRHLGGNGAGQFFASLCDGRLAGTPEEFILRATELRRQRLRAELERAKAKTDDESFEKVRVLLEQYDALKKPWAVNLAERNSASVKARSIPWLWHGVMPTHMATAITGDAGQGKSLVAIDLAARVSQGKPFPTYGRPGPPVKGHVFYITSEGVPEMILVPRLMAAGADLSKITVIEGTVSGGNDFQMFDITQHLPHVERRAKDFPDLKLVVIDPIASFLPERINPNQANSVRQAMDKVSTLAYKLGIAALTIMHFNKPTGAGGKAIHRTSGSVQFEASVKMSWSVIRREGDPIGARLLVPQKSNITGGHKSLAFSIHEVEFPAPDNPTEIITTAKIEYGQLVDEDPETLISPTVDLPENHVTLACEFLRRKLAEGKVMYAKPLIDEAEEHGVPKWALYRAKSRLGIENDREGTYQGRAFWFKPQGKPE